MDNDEILNHLMGFYDASSLEDLALIQGNQIARLQAKLDKLKPVFYNEGHTSPREG